MSVFLILQLCFAALAVASTRPIRYINTWGGPGQVQQNGTAPFTFAQATLVVPHLKVPKNPHQKVDQYSASMWIGIDGFKDSKDDDTVTGLWQAGFTMHIWTNGTTQYVGFWEWIPDPEQFLGNNFTVHAEDHIHVTLQTKANGTSASVTMENLNTTQSITHSQAAPVAWRGPQFPALGKTAEWIVESGTYSNYTKAVLPDFGTATFLDARACRSDGSCVAPGEKAGLQMFENFWGDTEMRYSTSEVEGDVVRTRYVEEKCEACKEQGWGLLIDFAKEAISPARVHAKV